MRYLELFGISVDEALHKPDVVTKKLRTDEPSASDAQPDEVARIRVILSNEEARYAYVQLFCLSYYESFDVPQDAKLSAINASYRKLANKYHEDKNRSLPDGFAKECMQRINEIRDTLRDDDKRSAYDNMQNAEEAEEVSDVDSEAEAEEFFGSKRKRKRNEDDDREETIYVSFTVEEFYRGVEERTLKRRKGGIKFRLPPRTVPGWIKVYRAPGAKPLTVRTGLRESFTPFMVSGSKLSRYVDVDMADALRGAGRIITETPDQRLRSRAIDRPLCTGDEVEFPDDGFGKEPMIGVVRLVPPKPALTRKQREAIGQLLGRA
jgi:DnaJ-domain-containing protein 1